MALASVVSVDHSTAIDFKNSFTIFKVIYYGNNINFSGFLFKKNSYLSIDLESKKIWKFKIKRNKLPSNVLKKEFKLRFPSENVNLPW